MWGIYAKFIILKHQAMQILRRILREAKKPLSFSMASRSDFMRSMSTRFSQRRASSQGKRSANSPLEGSGGARVPQEHQQVPEEHPVSQPQEGCRHKKGLSQRRHTRKKTKTTTDLTEPVDGGATKKEPNDEATILVTKEPLKRDTPFSCQLIFPQKVSVIFVFETAIKQNALK